MKFLNFFKTTWGIIILVVLVVAIILVSMNWETVKGWFSSTPAPGTTRGQAPGSSCIRVGDGCSYNGLYMPCAECTKRGIPIN